jgi:ATP-binding cassette subfamily F protein 3
MIAAHSLGIQLGGEYLFRDVVFTINPGDRVGLVGSNGAGKSTLMKMLIGLQEQDEGRVVTSRHAVIGYLPQEGIVLSNNNLRDEVMTAFKEAMELEQAIEEITGEIGRRHEEAGLPEFESLLHDLGELQHRYEAMNGFATAGEVEKILMGLGFSTSDFERSCQEFSGGWQMRIELAKLLLRAPDLLMLDEPTNHLDIESLTWLENFLQRYPGGILVISHDRTFLDRLTNRIFELSLGRLTVYTGNYSSYLEQRKERRLLQQAAFENQQKTIADTEKFIERFRYKATKATQVQSRIKALDRIDRVQAPEPDEASVHFGFPPAPRSGRVVVELEDITKAYDDKLVLDHVAFALERGEKVAFLGRNGEGKSTLSRIIAGIESYQEGTRTIGHNVSIGYYAQHQAEDLDPKKTVLETLDDVATGEIRTKLRTLLGAFLFQGDDVFKPVGVLSGGEKSRLALTKLLLEPANLLILDEPTNHLDMQSKQVLKNALMKYDGALILVSHDRDFLHGIIGKCFEFKNRAIREHLGGVEEYLERQQSGSIESALGMKAAASAQRNDKAASAIADGVDRKEQKRKEAELRNRRYAVTKELKTKFQKTESEITRLEGEKERIEGALADPATYSDPRKMTMLQNQLADIQKQLAGHYTDWERVGAEIEAAESGLE